MTFTHEFDRITIESLQLTGATKWAARDGSIGAFVAEMDFGAAPAIKRALKAAIDQESFGYLPANLMDELSDATTQMLARQYNWNVLPEDVHPVQDVLKVLEIAIEHHSRPGSKIIVPTPSYRPFLLFPPMMGREVIEVPMLNESGTYRLDLDGIGRAFEAGGNLLILCNPHNPTGRVFRRDEMEAVCALVDSHGGRVFADEIWAPLAFPPHQHVPYASVSATSAGHSITAISASKAWNLPGLKCAQVITSNDGDREQWRDLSFMAAHGTCNLGAVANIAAYRDGWDWRTDVLAYLQRNAAALGALIAERLPEVRYGEPDGTYVGWLDFRGAAVDGQPAAFFEQEARVRLTDGRHCGADFAGFARFIFATPYPIMELALERMAAALGKQR
ncbi:aminotransferase class I/II-fold pyridoxal phosphate-dependent enzyme [Novosphingobium sp. ERN07]|uniref:MalY/PatB family protein n=1 Tax=Novosphingobium sp. ERN07 TaxID=2726187 RepID=UPI00197F91FE